MVKKEFAEKHRVTAMRWRKPVSCPIPLSDAQLKSILVQLQSRKREDENQKDIENGTSKIQQEKTPIAKAGKEAQSVPNMVIARTDGKVRTNLI